MTILNFRVARAAQQDTPADLDRARRCAANNFAQSRSLIESAGPDTLRLLVQELRERIARDVGMLEYAEDQLARREGR